MCHCLNWLPPKPLSSDLWPHPDVPGHTGVTPSVHDCHFSNLCMEEKPRSGQRSPLVNLYSCSFPCHSEKLLEAIECFSCCPFERVCLIIFLWLAVWCLRLLIHRAHLVHFKECEKWVQKWNLTKGSLKPMGKASLCKRLIVCWDWGLCILCFLGFTLLILDPVERHERWDKSTMSEEPNHVLY